MSIKILYLEDELGMKHGLINSLKKEGYIVDIAPNVVDAYALLIENQNAKGYDLIIIDIYMDAKFLGKKHKLYEDRGGLCILLELEEHNININKIVFSAWEDEDVKRITNEKHIKYILKSEITNDDGRFQVIEEIKKIKK
ncbi:MAG: response regulator [Candidatus Magnetoovum sp. WYHC-5]|nr:response regulator [Candidatus Magnetoovum sp. WYHC-5]